MITPSFSLTATERVLPKLALDFTTASLDPRVTFTRALNTATRVNSSGYVEVVNADVPRFDFSPVTLACKGLLIEESRINVGYLTQDFASWTQVGGAVSADAVVSPDGTQNADTLIEDTSTGGHYVRQNVTLSNLAYTASVYVKAAGRTRFEISGNALGGVARGFDLSTGTTFANTLGAVEPTAYSITDAGNGWYRCSITGTSPGGTSSIRYYLNDGTSFSYTGNGTSGMSFWGQQLEAGAFPTSYIPNSGGPGTTVTRNADVATMTGTNFSSWWVATNGASDIWLTPKSTSTLAYMSFDDNTANNKIIIANNTTSGQSTITSGGTLQATLTAGTITANATNKVGCSWNTNNCAATANATTPATTASATIPTVTQLRIGSNGTSYANAWIQKLFYWPQRITNNEIQAFTK